MSLIEALPWILAFGMGGLLWLALREYRHVCEAHVKSLKLSNENIGLMRELLRALPSPTPQLPHGNTQAERRG